MPDDDYKLMVLDLAVLLHRAAPYIKTVSRSGNYRCMRIC